MLIKCNKNYERNSIEAGQSNLWMVSLYVCRICTNLQLYLVTCRAERTRHQLKRHDMDD